MPKAKHEMAFHISLGLTQNEKMVFCESYDNNVEEGFSPPMDGRKMEG
ncbi:MAG: hypothetical protein ABH886_04890 [Candidatus Desantisbacteria bacterium]